MSAFDQAELFEPTGSAVGALALTHLRRAESFERSAVTAATLGWVSVERGYRREAARERIEAECLAMLADFERFGGVS